jgi:hypothetical protein
LSSENHHECLLNYLDDAIVTNHRETNDDLVLKSTSSDSSSIDDTKIEHVMFDHLELVEAQQQVAFLREHLNETNGNVH